ncbi:PH domain-containing protein [Pseudomonas sp. RT6P73]
MGRYIDSAITKGEKIIYEGKISIWAMMPLIVPGIIFTALFGIGLILLAIAAIRYFTTELAVTNKRVIAKFGFIKRATIEINIHKIESIQVHQGILGRIFNFGTIIVSGAGNPQAPLPGISRPLVFRRAFLHTQEEISESRLP